MPAPLTIHYRSAFYLADGPCSGDNFKPDVSFFSTVKKHCHDGRVKSKPTAYFRLLFLVSVGLVSYTSSVRIHI